MKPSIAVDITARDKTDAGSRSAEARFGKFAKKTGSLARESGLGKLGKQLEGLTKFKGLSLGFESAPRSLSAIGSMAGAANSNVAALATNVLGLGGVAKGAFGEMAEGAGLAAGAVAGTTAAVIGLGVATYMLGDKWAKTGGEIDRTSKSLSVSSTFLQTARAANERFGVSADQTTASIDALGSTLYDAKYGANNLALGVMNQLGVKLKATKDGAIDVAAAYDDIADAIARQKDPLVQRKMAAVFGLSSALPAIRQGSAKLNTERADYQASGAALSEDQVVRSETVERKTVTLRQHLGAIEKKAGMAAMAATDAGADVGLTALRDGGKAVSAITGGAQELVHGAAEAGRRLVDGAKEAGRAIGEEFEAFVHRIEHQESRGRQFDRSGSPLTSSAGAVGAMQMLPDTARRAAAYAGVRWDPERFRTDKAYNERLGRAELQRLTAKFGGDEVLAAAAYNAGEGRLTGSRRHGRHVPGWLETIGDPRKGQVSDQEFADRIPFKETRDYVANTAGKAKVEITLRGAPAGTVVRTTPAQGTDVSVEVARSLDGP